VKVVKVAVVGHRPEEVVLDKAVCALDPAFFIAFRRRGKFDVEAETTTKLGELRVLLPIAAAQDLRYCCRGVVEYRRSRDAAECGEAGQQPGKQRRMVATHRCACHEETAIAQPQHKQLYNDNEAGKSDRHGREVEL